MAKGQAPMHDDALIEEMLGKSESYRFDCKRLVGKLTRILETVVAFANADGGVLALGFEDPDKGQGRDRVYGIQESLTNWDELQRSLQSRITEPHVLIWSAREVGCTLRDGQAGSVALLTVQKSPRVHSIVDDGTWLRMEKGNRELTAPEITELCFARGTISAETQLEAVDFDLLDTAYWRQYAQQRRLTRPIDQAMRHLGLAKPDPQGQLQPTRAAVLLFAEDPSGLLQGKAAIRVFHYRGGKVQADPRTNLLKTPRTIAGPLIRQIHDATDYIVQELATGVQMGPLGFEIVQRYPLRVIKEAITNAVIHRDYHLPTDIHVRIFSDRIEVESPGLLAGPVTAQNIAQIGTHSRNPVLVGHLREFPNPPNLDAGEGVPMMFQTMRDAQLYVPVYLTRPYTKRDAVLVVLINENRPSVWEQVSQYIDDHGSIGNTEVKKLLGTTDTLRASQQLRAWRELGLLVVANPHEGKRIRRYTKPGTSLETQLFSKPK